MACKDILDQGIRDKFNYLSEEQFRYDLKLVINMSTEERRKTREEKESSLSVGLLELLTLGLDGSKTIEDYEELKRTLSYNKSLAWESRSYLNIVSELINKDVVQAWSKCMNIRGVNLSFVGDIDSVDGEMFLVADYYPMMESDQPLQITSFIITGADILIPGRLATGATLERFSGLSTLCARKGRSAVTAVVTFDKVNVEPVKLPEIPPRKRIVPVHFSINDFGGWPRIEGDREMDTDSGDKVKVKSESVLYKKGDSILLEYSFYCEEYKGDHTTFRGTRTKTVYKAPSGEQILEIQAKGGPVAKFNKIQKGESHDFYPFDVNNTYWNSLEYRVDRDGKRDSGIVGIGGAGVFKVVLQEI